MKKISFLALFFIIFSGVLSGQKYDFYIEPIDQITETPTAFDNSLGSAAPVFHETYQFRGNIAQAIGRKVAVFIHDTASEFDNPFINNFAHNDLAGSYTGEPFGDSHGHGHLVAGCIAAYSPQYPLGVASMLTPENLWIIPNDVLAENGGGNYDWVIESLNDAINKGAQLQSKGFFIIHNLSLGGTVEYDKLKQPIERARSLGQLVVIAAGNTGGTPIQVPGRYKGANAITAIDKTGNRAYFSSYGPEAFTAAMGVDVLSTLPGKGTSLFTGTSAASPVMVGFFAVIAATNPTATANQIEQMVAALVNDLGDPGRDQIYGFGTPKYSSFMGRNAIDYKDEAVSHPADGDTPGPDPELTRESREVIFDLENYSINWMPSGSNKFEKLNVDLKISLTTTLYDDVAFDKVKSELDWFFKNRFLVLKPEHGFRDATYWAGYFAEMLVNRQPSELVIIVEKVTGSDEQKRTASVYRKSLHKLTAKVETMRRGGPYQFSLPGN